MNDVRLHPSSPNPDLQAIHIDLIALVQTLERSIDTAPNAEAIVLLTEQIAEVNTRVTAIGGLLFAQQTEEITCFAKVIAEALPGIENEIADTQKCLRAVQSVTALLSAVDSTIRLARQSCG